MSNAEIETNPLEIDHKAETKAISSTQGLRRLDLSAIKADTSLSLHKLLKTRVTNDNIMALITVIDLDHVYMTDEAAAALSRSYVMTTFLIDKFGIKYRKNVAATATSGKLKGMTYINSNANEYVHETDDGIEIVVSGKCVELDGKKTRQLHITCRKKQPVVVSESVSQ